MAATRCTPCASSPSAWRERWKLSRLFGISGRGRKQSIKEEVATGIFFAEPSFPLLVGPQRKLISIADIEAIKDKEFVDQRAAVRAMGFDVDVRRATVGRAKHVRTRPRFDQWAVDGSVLVNTTGNITLSVVNELFSIAGMLRGIGDWRPCSKKPGPFGTFTAEIAKAK